jgi:ASC-1-like (ASCH) protein
MTTHNLSFRDPNGFSLYEQIIKGNKVVEGRKFSPTNQKIMVGDLLILHLASQSSLRCEVMWIHLYRDVREYLESEGLVKCFGTPDDFGILTTNEGIDVYKQFVDENEIETLYKTYGTGFMGIGIKFISN